jgi:hypothetical protein
MITLVASAARGTSGDSGPLSPAPIANPELIRGARFVLRVTAAATEATDTLDVYIQQSYDGTNFDDLVHFTQVLGNGGAKTFVGEWYRDVSPESELHAPQDAAIAVGVLQGGKIGFPLRVKWVIVDPGGGAASFTFSVTAEFDRR